MRVRSRKQLIKHRRRLKRWFIISTEKHIRNTVQEYAEDMMSRFGT